MSELITVLISLTAGTVFTLVGVCLGANLMKRAYVHITDPHQIVFQEDMEKDESRGVSGEASSYDWDSYDQYIARAEDDEDDGGVPEA